MNNLSSDGSDSQEDTPLLPHELPTRRYYSSQTSVSFSNNEISGNSTNPDSYESPAPLRPRTNTMSSIMSGYQIVKEHMDKRKFGILLLISISIYLGFVALFAPRTSLSRDIRRWHSSRFINAEVYRIYLNSLQETNLAKEHLHELTNLKDSQDNLGNDAFDEYMIKTLKNMGFSPIVESYYPWVSQPVNTEVKLLKNGEEIWNARMIEDKFNDQDSNSTKIAGQLKGYNAYAPNGNVTTQFVYCNYGTLNDYTFLIENNIDIEGKIHIVRYGKLNRGLKVRNAELYGASSVLFYNDPNDDDGITESNGFSSFPYGPARNPSAIERGTVQYFTDFPGDPTTPNYPSRFPDVERLNPVGKLPRIPSIPMSIRDITPILQELNKNGISWSNTGDIVGFDYSSGPSKDGVMIKLINEQKHSIEKINNIIVDIPGIFSDGETIIGAHKDSVTPISSATIASSNVVLLEIARGLRSLLRRGWKPLRPIRLVSWDGNGHGLMGATESIEEHSPMLKQSTLAYLNLDNNVITGSTFTCHANPLFQEIIYEAAKYTNFKNEDDLTLYEQWVKDSNGTIGLLDGTSDYVPFQYHLGVPSVSFSFVANKSKGEPVIMSNSGYDSLEFIEQFADPDFQLHNTMSMVTGLTALMISESELHLFKTHAYFKSVFKSYQVLYQQILDSFPHDNQLQSTAISLKRLIESLTWHVSVGFDKRSRNLSLQCRQDYPIWSFMTKFRIYLRLLRINDKLKQLDGLFVNKTGLNDRPWLKHSLFASNKYTGLDGIVLPGLFEAITELNRDEILQWLDTLSVQLNNVKYLLH